MLQQSLARVKRHRVATTSTLAAAASSSHLLWSPASRLSRHLHFIVPEQPCSQPFPVLVKVGHLLAAPAAVLLLLESSAL